MTEIVLFIESALNLDIGDAIDIDGETVTITGIRDETSHIFLTYRDSFNEQIEQAFDPYYEFSVMGVVQ